MELTTSIWWLKTRDTVCFVMCGTLQWLISLWVRNILPSINVIFVIIWVWNFYFTYKVMVLTETEFFYFHSWLLCKLKICLFRTWPRVVYSFGKLQHKQLCIQSYHIHLMSNFVPAFTYWNMCYLIGYFPFPFCFI